MDSPEKNEERWKPMRRAHGLSTHRLWSWLFPMNYGHCVTTLLPHCHGTATAVLSWAGSCWVGPITIWPL